MLSTTQLPVCLLSVLLTTAEAGLPWDGIAENEYTVMAYTHHGGHLGWFMWGGKRWFVTAVGDYFELVEKTVNPGVSIYK